MDLERGVHAASMFSGQWQLKSTETVTLQRAIRSKHTTTFFF